MQEITFTSALTLYIYMCIMIGKFVPSECQQ